MNINEKQGKSHSDQTRDRLLLSGLNLLAKKGYRGAVTREIALGAGVTEMTMYRHFHSKDELFAAAVIQNGELLLSLVPEPSGDVEADLLLISTSMSKEISSNFMQLIRIIPEIEDHSEIKEQMAHVKDQLSAKILSLINHYQSQDATTGYKDEMIFYMFLGPIFLFSMDARDSGSTFDSQQHVRFFLLGCGLGDK